MKKRSNVISVPRHLSNCAILPRSATNNSLLYYFSLSYYTLLHIICYTYSTVYYTITVQYYSILYIKTGNIVPFGLPKGKVPKYVKKSLVFYQVNIEENMFYLAPDSPFSSSWPTDLTRPPPHCCNVIETSLFSTDVYLAPDFPFLVIHCTTLDCCCNVSELHKWDVTLLLFTQSSSHSPNWPHISHISQNYFQN